MKQQAASFQFGFISRGFLVGLAIAGGALTYGCSIKSTSSPDGSSGGPTPGTTGPVVDASKLGQECSGGTSPGDTVAFNDDTCGAGVCIVDATNNDLNVYCSADCSNAQCPSGYVCKATTIGGTNDCFVDPNAPANDGGSSSTTGTTGGACVTLSGSYAVAATQSALNANTCQDIPSGTSAAFDQSDAGSGCTQSFDAASCTYTNICTTDDGEGDTSKLTMTINTTTLQGSFDLVSTQDEAPSVDCTYNVTLSK